MKLEGDTPSKGDIVLVTKNLDELKTAQGERGTLLKNSGKTSLQQLWKGRTGLLYANQIFPGPEFCFDLLDNFYLKKGIYTLFDGFTDNTRGYFTSCVVFFQAPQGRGKVQAMSKMSASIICKTIE